MNEIEDNCNCSDGLSISNKDLQLELSEDEVLSLAEMFKLLGDPTRMKILLSLSQKELCVCDLAAVVGMTVSAISHQLRFLRNGRIVKNRRSGKSIYYSLDDEHIRTIIKMSHEHICNKC